MDNETLVLQYQNSYNADEKRDILGQLYTQNEGLIGFVVSRYAGIEDPEDLKQQCFFGLCEAVKRWEPNGGASFAGYAVYWLRNAVRRYLDECGHAIRLPSGMIDKVLQYKKVCADYAAKYGQKPSDSTLEYLLDLNEDQLIQVRKAEQQLTVSSSSAIISDDLTLGDTFADPVDYIAEADDQIQKEQLSAALWGAVEELPEREGRVLRMRYKEGQTFSVCGEALGVGTSRARQLEVKALRKLRSPALSKRLTPFLEDLAEQYGYHSSGIGSFRRSGASSVERAVMAAERMQDGLT